MSDAAIDLYAVLRLVRPLHQYAAKAVADQLADEQITMAMRAVLERLRDGGPQPVPQLARSLWLDRQPVQRVVDLARELELVETRENPAHQRSPLIALTDAGQAAFARIHDAELQNLAALAGTLDPAEVASAVRVMQALTDHLREEASRGAPDHGWAVPGPRPGEEIR